MSSQTAYSELVDVHAPAVPADLDHLGAAGQGLVGRGGVGLAADDPAQADRAGLARVGQVADVVLLELAGAPAGHVQPAVVHRQVDVGDQRRHRPERLEGRRQQLGVGRLGRDGDDLVGHPPVPVLLPEEDRPGEVLDADDHADEPPGLGRVVGRAELQHHLVLVAQVDPLGQLALGHAPEVQVVAEACRPSRSSGLRPFSNMDGVAHSEVMTVSWLRCHHTS